jgi:hypothetical protein
MGVDQITELRTYDHGKSKFGGLVEADAISAFRLSDAEGLATTDILPDNPAAKFFFFSFRLLEYVQC